MLSRMLPAALLAMAVAAPAQAQQARFMIPASAVTLTMSWNADCALAPGLIYSFDPGVLIVNLTNTSGSAIASFSMTINLHGANVRIYHLHFSSDREYHSGMMLIPVRAGFVPLPATLENGRATIVIDNCTLVRRP